MGNRKWEIQEGRGPCHFLRPLPQSSILRREIRRLLPPFCTLPHLYPILYGIRCMNWGRHFSGLSRTSLNLLEV